jgi:hypothetical protein
MHVSCHNVDIFEQRISYITVCSDIIALIQYLREGITATK